MGKGRGLVSRTRAPSLGVRWGSRSPRFYSVILMLKDFVSGSQMRAKVLTRPQSRSDGRRTA